MKIKAVRGVKDILPDEVKKWQITEMIARDIFEIYGFSEIKIPIFENTTLFYRGIGETTDIVEKEMYTFVDKGGEEITLRPEATASIVRAYIEHKLYKHPSVLKVYCLGPMFRYERPQAGRQRQFYQINVEAIGSDSPFLDAEIISMLDQYLDRLEIENRSLLVNSLGCKECRPRFKEALTSFLEKKINGLCKNCKDRFKRNPLRILDCKEDNCNKTLVHAPTTREFICKDCNKHFKEVQRLLTQLKINYKIEDHLVRGLDYYTKTAFEVTVKGLGAQNAIAGGGRYDNLVEEVGGPSTPAIGFAVGLERLVSILNIKILKSSPTVFITSLGKKADEVAFKILDKLRSRGISSEKDYEPKSLKSQMRKADKHNVKYVMILGDNEIKKGKLILKDMRDGKQKEIGIKGIEDHIRKLLKR